MQGIEIHPLTAQVLSILLNVFLIVLPLIVAALVLVLGGKKTIEVTRRVLRGSRPLFDDVDDSAVQRIAHLARTEPQFIVDLFEALFDLMNPDEIPPSSASSLHSATLDPRDWTHDE